MENMENRRPRSARKEKHRPIIRRQPALHGFLCFGAPVKKTVTTRPERGGGAHGPEEGGGTREGKRWAVGGGGGDVCWYTRYKTNVR